MAYDTPARLQRRGPFAVRRVDHLQASVRLPSDMVARPDRLRVHGSVRKVRDSFNLVWAFLILGIFATAGSALITLGFIRWRG